MTLRIAESPRRISRTVAALLLVLPLVGAGMAVPAFAQEGEQGKKETVQAQVLTEKTFKLLTEANKAIEENRLAEAAPILDRLLGDTKLTPFERATVLQTRGFLLTEQDNYKEAAKYFEQAVDLKILVPDQQLALIYNLAQIYAGTEQYKKSVEKFEIWFAQATNPQPPAYLAYANSLYNLERFQEAIPKVEMAIKIANEPKREWYDFLAGLYFETKQIPKVAQILELLVSKYPGEGRYYRQLQGVYSELKRERDMLAITELAYKGGHLEKSEEFVQLASLLLYFDNPYRAAVLLEKKLKEGKIEKNYTNYEMLANAWIASRDVAKSIEPLIQAAELAKDGNGYIRLAQAYVEREDWSAVNTAIEKALERGGLKEIGQAYLLEGVALINLDRLGPARKAFVEAAKSKGQERVARQWVRHIDKILEEQAARQQAALQ